MPVLLVISYPVLVHLSVLFGWPVLQAIALTCLTAGFSLGGLKQGNPYLWCLVIFVCITTISLSLLDVSIYLLYIPPVAIPLLLFCVFSFTLLPGKEPIVTAIGEASRGPLSKEMRSYTKIVTWMWSVIFLILITLGVALPLTGNQLLWSWTTSVWNYAVVGLIFLGEFIYRIWRFPDHDHPNFIEYIKIVVTANVSRP